MKIRLSDDTFTGEIQERLENIIAQIVLYPKHEI